MTPTSTRARRSSSKATAVIASKNVAVLGEAAVGEAGGLDGEDVARSPARRRRASTGTPSIAIRSSGRTRCGEV